MNWVAHDWQADASGRNESLGGIFGGEGWRFEALQKSTSKSFLVSCDAKLFVGRSFSGHFSAGPGDVQRELKSKKRVYRSDGVGEFLMGHFIASSSLVEFSFSIPSTIHQHLRDQPFRSASIVKMVRKLKHHEQKLLKKTDFITYKQDNDHRDHNVIRRTLTHFLASHG